MLHNPSFAFSTFHMHRQEIFNHRYLRCNSSKGHSLSYMGCTQDLGHSFSQYGPPGRQITYICVGYLVNKPLQAAGMSEDNARGG